MLPSPYHWTHRPHVSLLHFNCRGVATVRPDGNGKWPHSLRWQGNRFEGVAGSREQAQAWIERWIEARGNDMPGNIPRR